MEEKKYVFMLCDEYAMDIKRAQEVVCWCSNVLCGGAREAAVQEAKSGVQEVGAVEENSEGN